VGYLVRYLDCSRAEIARRGGCEGYGVGQNGSDTGSVAMDFYPNEDIEPDS
jgi:hypothetical protein